MFMRMSKSAQELHSVIFIHYFINLFIFIYGLIIKEEQLEEIHFLNQSTFNSKKKWISEIIGIHLGFWQAVFLLEALMV